MADSSPLRSVPWTARQALATFVLPWVVLPVVALVLLGLIAPHEPLVHQFLTALDQGDTKANFGLVVVDALGSYAVIAYFLRKQGGHWRQLGFHRFSAGKALLYVLGLMMAFALSIGVIYVLVQALVPGFNADQPQTNEFTQTAPSLRTYSLLALVIIPPLVEETVFRGFIFPAFSKRFGLVFGAISSSVLFGFAHLQANVSVYTFFLGLVLCFMYARLRSIVPGMALHMLNNYIAYTALNQTK